MKFESEYWLVFIQATIVFTISFDYIKNYHEPINKVCCFCYLNDIAYNKIDIKNTVGSVNRPGRISSHSLLDSLTGLPDNRQTL